ncbi:MAG: cytochrome c3 family protein [Myxococcota bacterium]
MSVIFPRWTNGLPTIVAIAVPLIGFGVVCGISYYFSPYFTDVGYQPEQPVEYSHALHAGKLGMDCRYCHNTVERAGYAAVPPTQTCLNCHAYVKTESPKLELVRQSGETGEPIPWIKIHQLPDYAYFAHNVHVAAGIGCASCHGRIDQMEKVALHAPLSMGWCLRCHRNPEPHLRPVSEITNMAYDPVAAGYDPAADPHRTRELQPPQNCSGCHR